MRPFKQFSRGAALTAIVWGCVGSVGAAAELERQPYIQQLGANQATVVWTTTEEADGTLAYGTDRLSLDQEVVGAASAMMALEATDLMPATRYYYAVQVDGKVLAGGDEDHYFETAPETGTRAKFRAWVLGDSGTGKESQAAVLDAMTGFTGETPLDLILHMGDIAYPDGTESEMTDNHFGVYGDILTRTVFWPTYGNHDAVSADADLQTGPYFEAFVLPTDGEIGGVASQTEAYYSFDFANVHFIVLDSSESDHSSDGTMMTWAAADLAATMQEWIVAFWHHPPYSKGSHDSDEETSLVEMREGVMPIMESGGVDVVLTGHSHSYERSYLVDGAYASPSTTEGIVDENDGDPSSDGPYEKEAGITANGGTVVLVAGHSGQSVSGDGDHPVMAVSEFEYGSVVLDVHENRLEITNVRWDEQITDRVALVKGEGLILYNPISGDAFQYAEPHTIEWSTVGDIATVDLHYSCDGGASWLVIEEAISNENQYEWTVPSIDSDAMLVRVRNSVNPEQMDETNGVFSVMGSATETLVSWGAEWSYDDSGADHGTAWLESDFDDSSWSTGVGEFGYGDDDEATVLNDTEPNYPSYYFRKTINVDGELVSANVDVVYDDGIAIWVNGTLVLEANVDNGTDFDDWASSGGAESSTMSVEIDVTDFVDGENTVAVMVKQENATSSDVSFDLELVAEILASGKGAECPNATGDSGDSGGKPTDTSKTDSGPSSSDSAVSDTDGSGGGAGSSGDKYRCGCGNVQAAVGGAWVVLLGLCGGLVRRRRS